jgi:hypothetical protein
MGATSECLRNIFTNYSPNANPQQTGSRSVEGKPEVIALTRLTGIAGSSIVTLLLEKRDAR